MNHAVLNKRRVAVRGDVVASGNRAALINRNVDDNRAAFHSLNHFLRDELRSLRAGHEHRADKQVGLLRSLRNIVAVAHDRANSAAENVVEIAEPLNRQINNCDAGT